MADHLSKGKALFLGMLQVEIAFFFPITFHARMSISADSVPPWWQQGKEAVGLVGWPEPDFSLPALSFQFPCYLVIYSLRRG